MPKPVQYFQVDFRGEESTTPSSFGEGEVQRSVIVEVSREALPDVGPDAPLVEEATEVARTTANEVIRDELAVINNPDGDVTPLKSLPAHLAKTYPDIDDEGIRAWRIESDEASD